MSDQGLGNPSTSAEHLAALDRIAESNEAVVASNAAVVARLDEERYWRTEWEKRKTRGRWTLVGAVLALVLVLAGIGKVVLDNQDTADSIRTYQQTVSSTRGERIEGGMVVLLCAGYPSVHPEEFVGASQEVRAVFLSACLTANGVNVDDLIEVPTDILPSP